MIEDLEEFEKNETRKLLNEYEIPFNWLGYKYLISAVPYVIDKINSNEKVVFKKLYQEIAKRHKTTYTKVEYAIRYLHENTNIAKKMNYEKVTNQSLIIILALTIMDKYKL